jgi:hypothetical protein
MTIWILLIVFLLPGNVLGDKTSRCNNISFFQSYLTRHYLISTMVTSTRRNTEAAALLQVRKDHEKQRLDKKKVRAEEKNAEEEAAKAKATIEEAARKMAEANSRTAAESTVSPDPSTMDKPDDNINNHLTALNNPTTSNKKDESSSPKKSKQKTKHGSLKSLLKSSNVDPLANYQHEFNQCLISAAIVISGEDDKERALKLVRCVKELYSELQSIDKTTRLNHLYEQSVSIFKPDLIPENQTQFGCYVSLSSFNNKNPFGKKRVYYNNKKKKNAEAEWTDPTIYLQFSISSDKDPHFILDRTRGQWHFMGGTRLEVKEIQVLHVVTTHMVFNLSCTTNKEVLTYELRNMMTEARKINEEEGNIDEDPCPLKAIPKFLLTNKMPRLAGIDTKSLNSNLSYEEQNLRRCIHLECSADDAPLIKWLIAKVKKLTRFGEEKPIIEIYWGKHVLLTEVLVSGKTSPGEIKKMNKMSQYHGNYSMSMCQDNLTGATNIDTKVVLATCEEKDISIFTSLRDTLLTLVAYPSDKDNEKEHRLFAEVHQGGNPGDIVTVVYPNTPEAEKLVMSMNKNLPVILKCILTSQGVAEEVINDLLRKSICPSHLAQMSNFTYDEKTRTLTSLKDDTQDKALEDMFRASWFSNKFNMDVLLNDKKKAKEDGPPAEFLFDIDGTRSIKTIHDKPRELDKASDVTKKKSMVAFEVESSSDSSSYKSEKDDASASSSLDLGVNNEGSTPSVSSVRSDPTALNVMDTTITLDNAQDSTMCG